MTDTSVTKRTDFKAVYAVALVSMIDQFGFGLLFPVLPKLTAKYGGGGMEMGWLMALYAMMQLVFNPLMGALSDRIGRKPLLFYSLIGLAGGHVLFAMTDRLLPIVGVAHAFTLMYLARVLTGVFSAHGGVAQAYVVDHTAPEDRAKALGITGIGGAIGFVMGPAIGGVAAHYFGIFSAFWFAAGAALAGAGLTMLVLKPGVANRPEAAVVPAVNHRQVLAETWQTPGQKGALMLFFLLPFGFSAVEMAIVMFGQNELGITEIMTGKLFLFAGAVLVFTQGFLLGWLRKHLKETWLIRGGALFLSLGVMLIPMAQMVQKGGWTLTTGMQAWWLLVFGALAFVCLGEGLKEPSLVSYFSQRANPLAQGGTLGIAHATGAVARVLGPVAAGRVYDGMGPAWPFYLGGAVMFAGFLVSLKGITSRPYVRPVPALAVGGG